MLMKAISMMLILGLDFAYIPYGLYFFAMGSPMTSQAGTQAGPPPRRAWAMQAWFSAQWVTTHFGGHHDLNPFLNPKPQALCILP